MLVRGNAFGEMLANRLKAEGIEGVVWEGESAILDTPALSGFLDLVQLADHPGDVLAYRHFQLTPLAAAKCPDGVPDAAELSREMSLSLTTRGMVRTLRALRALGLAIAKSFNRLVVDGDESTNDSVFIMASGRAGNPAITRAGADFDAFRAALEAVCVSLARQMAADGEGATKFVTVTVRGARSEKDAARAARAVAKSPLAKTSWFGRDPNWGRVLAAVGYSGADVEDMKAEVFYDRVWAFRRGQVADEAQLKKLAKVLEKPSFEVVVDLHLGKGESSVYTCDFSLDYVHINADYTT